MAEEELRLIRRQIRSPRSAAIAGIVYSLLMMISMLLLTSMARPIRPMLTVTYWRRGPAPLLWR